MRRQGKWTRLPHTVALASAGVLAATAVAACGSGGSSQATTTASGGTMTTTTAPTSALESTPWTLDNASLPTTAGVAITATFADGRVQGNSGCNQYTGTYQVDGSNLTVDGRIAGTLMACAPPIAEAEAAFLAKLPQTASFKATDTRLDLLDAGGTTILTFAATDLSLTGTWDVTSYRTPNAVISPIVGSEATVTFGPDGTVTGNSGCADFTGTYSTDGTKVSITGLAPATATGCVPEVAQQHSDLLAALQQAASMQVTGRQVTLLTEEGTIAASLGSL